MRRREYLIAATGAVLGTGLAGCLGGNGDSGSGGEAEVDTPGNAPLKFDESFEVRAETRTVFTADFTPVKRGQQDSYILKPVAEGVEVEYDSEGESGTETETEPEDGTESGSDTATATPTTGE